MATDRFKYVKTETLAAELKSRGWLVVEIGNVNSLAKLDAAIEKLTQLRDELKGAK